MSKKTVNEAINYRRSVRVYDNEQKIESEIVKKCNYGNFTMLHLNL